MVYWLVIIWLCTKKKTCQKNQKNVISYVFKTWYLSWYIFCKMNTISLFNICTIILYPIRIYSLISPNFDMVEKGKGFYWVWKNTDDNVSTCVVRYIFCKSMHVVVKIMHLLCNLICTEDGKYIWYGWSDKSYKLCW